MTGALIQMVSEYSGKHNVQKGYYEWVEHSADEKGNIYVLRNGDAFDRIRINGTPEEIGCIRLHFLHSGNIGLILFNYDAQTIRFLAEKYPHQCNITESYVELILPTPINLIGSQYTSFVIKTNVPDVSFRYISYNTSFRRYLASSVVPFQWTQTIKLELVAGSNSIMEYLKYSRLNSVHADNAVRIRLNNHDLHNINQPTDCLSVTTSADTVTCCDIYLCKKCMYLFSYGDFSVH